MIIHTLYVYPLVHAGEVSVGAVVGSIIPLTTIGTIIFGIVVVNTIIVALVIARKRKAKECGTVDIKPIVSVDKYSMQILVYCTVNFMLYGAGLLQFTKLNCCLKLV